MRQPWVASTFAGVGDGDRLVWDNAMHGHRGRDLSQPEANEPAANLELQYDRVSGWLRRRLP